MNQLPGNPYAQHGAQGEPDWQTLAQAIINVLGLTIETHATDQSRNPHTRIISEWKRP